ncbi:MAG: hypothetical protein RLZZ225_568 [Pseudomonadota bacterium]|jgi:hypothetical protein
MEGKLYALITYAFAGLIIALWPVFAKEKLCLSNSKFYGLVELSSGWIWKSGCLAIATIGIILLSGKSTVTIVLSFALISLALSFASKKFDVLLLTITFLVLCVSATLPWWCRQGGLSLKVNTFSLVTLCCFTFLFDHVFKIKEQPLIINHSFSIKWLIPYTLLAGVLSFSTGIFHYQPLLLGLWHHWSAYIGPAELLLSGATILHDFPAQYGLGPTALIASVCGRDCWQGMYFIAGSSTLIISVLIAALALSLTRKYWSERLIALALSLATCFFWTSYPPLSGSPIETPSVTGLRFLPAILIVTYLFFIKQIERSKLKIRIAHCFWAFGALWSPESAFYVTCIWWPYYIFIQRISGTFLLRCKNFINSLATLFLISISFTIIFSLIFRLIYHKIPSIYAFLIYAFHPPGAMPINPQGGVWYFIVTVVIGVSTLIYLWGKSGDSRLFRSGLLLTLLNYSVFSYFLGRSHENNLLNITPFLLLVLLHAISSIDSKIRLGYILNRTSVVCTVAMLSWLPNFGWDAWRENIEKYRLFYFEPKLVSHSLRIFNASTSFRNGAIFPMDALRAIDFIQKNYNEPFIVFNDRMGLINNFSRTSVWSAINGAANYAYIPAQDRREFMQLTADSLHRSGWLIIDKNFSSMAMLADFDFVYQRTKQLQFGTYNAIHFSPKKGIG